VGFMVCSGNAVDVNVLDRKYIFPDILIEFTNVMFFYFVVFPFFFI